MPTSPRPASSPKKTKKSVVVCEKCGRTFKSNGGRLLHETVVHGGKTEFSCVHESHSEPKYFATQALLNRHMRIHAAARPCGRCGAEFADRNNVTRHYRLFHEGIEPENNVSREAIQKLLNVYPLTGKCIVDTRGSSGSLLQRVLETAGNLVVTNNVRSHKNSLMHGNPEDVSGIITRVKRPVDCIISGSLTAAEEEAAIRSHVPMVAIYTSRRLTEDREEGKMLPAPDVVLPADGKTWYVYGADRVRPHRKAGSVQLQGSVPTGPIATMAPIEDEEAVTDDEDISPEDTQQPLDDDD